VTPKVSLFVGNLKDLLMWVFTWTHNYEHAGSSGLWINVYALHLYSSFGPGLFNNVGTNGKLTFGS